MGEMKKIESGFSRRQLVVTATTAAGGMALTVLLPGQKAKALGFAPLPSASESAKDEVNLWVVIEPDDTTILRIPQSEMGQGTATGLAQMMAEELGCDWSKVRAEYASANRNVREKEAYGQMFTVGSFGLRSSVRAVQQGGASARARLIAAAAKRWNVPASECVAANSKVTHAASKRSLRYGELVADAAKITLDKEPEIKTPDQFSNTASKPLPRLDTPVKVNGEAKFGIDTRLPGMVYAAIQASPVPGGALVSVDDSSLKGKRGNLKVVKLPNAVAVVGDSWWRANEALKGLKITWDAKGNEKVDSEQLRQAYRDMLNGPMTVARNDGDAIGTLAKSKNVIEATYETPLLAHATMEPLNATVQLTKDRLDIWMGSQQQLNNTKQAAGVAGLKPEQVYLHNCYLGGGFGRRSNGDELVQAIAVAKEVGKPVKLVWTREEDMRQDRYRPQSAIRFRAALGADGIPSAIHVVSACGSIMKANGMGRPDNPIDSTSIDGIIEQVPYTKIKNFKGETISKNFHIPVSFWRSVGGSQNCFYMESFIDELAYAAGQDPLEFRLAMVERADYRSVLNKLKDVAWGPKLPQGRGRGIALTDNHGGVLAHCAEVTVSDKGEVHVDKVTSAIDVYNVANPQLVKQQCEGGVIYGLSAMLYGEITVKDGAVEQGNFDTYQMITLADCATKIEAHLALTGGVDDKGQPKWGGVGECTVAPLAPAIANAIFAATGKRIRSLPFKNLKLSQLAKI